ncbi:NUDIX hydrolase [Clostridium sp. CF011]|uniref:NUDIX hydrolase n=1 Tax=Clostridium sp. CF011 TaxID=2843318 RepID=UPI001C0C209B|nr:NUDIX hydrolase [Clostridium sp. CF011]MBU3090875.1 NUDIX hydrolase [Clostridium sp. CF011]WAG69646.1 NUDIX hydrolase [Clostridium sp. CF011]
MDITFYNNNETVFNYRTCEVITDDKKILLHRMEDDDFWVLVGGRVQMLESSECAIKREIIEELGEDIEINRLLWTVENFFKFREKDYYEITMIYLVSLQKESWIKNQQDSFSGIEGKRLIYKWFNFDELNELNIKPSFLIEKLIWLPNHTNHLINREY